MILGPLATGVSFEAAPLVRHIAASAYRAGAPLVEVLWGDESLLLTRCANARRDSLSEFSTWLPKALTEHVEAGHAVLSIYANDPDLLKNEPPEVVGALQQATARAVQPFRELISRNETNWAVIAAAGSGWAAKVFPDRRPDEQAFARFLGQGHVRAVSTEYGRMALYFILKAMELPPGSEIIVPALTFWVVPEIVRAAGFTPVFADIDPATFTLSPAALERAITPSTRAVVPTHLYGLACDLDPIMALARRHNLKVIEDCAHSLGATYNG